MIGMIGPVPSSIRGEGKVGDGISVDFVIELEEDAETGVCRDSMRGFGEKGYRLKVRRRTLAP
jgi:hypothetical protein